MTTDTLLDATSTRMYAEAQEAGEAVARQFAANADIVDDLAERLQKQPPRFIVTCARGSSDHAATYGKYLFETQLGLVTASASPSVGSVYAIQPKLDGALFVTVSQSGKSPDLVRNAEIAKAAGAHVVALVNVTDSPLARIADTVLGLHAGPETSVAATKSYLCSLAALLQLTARWSNDAALFNAVHALPDALGEAWRQDWSPLVDGLVDAHNLFVVGRGLGLGAAQEAALKFKETCGLHAEAFSSAEVRHGPMAIVGPGFPVLAFAQDDGTGDGTVAVAREFRTRGAPVWLAAPGVPGGDVLPTARSVHPALTPLLTVASFYKAVNALSVARGHNPDLPPHLNKVTETV